MTQKRIFVDTEEFIDGVWVNNHNRNFQYEENEFEPIVICPRCLARCIKIAPQRIVGFDCTNKNCDFEWWSE